MLLLCHLFYLLCSPFFPASKYIKMFVLDEADEMLSRGFKDQIYEIFQKLTTSIQVRMWMDRVFFIRWDQARYFQA